MVGVPPVVTTKTPVTSELLNHISGQDCGRVEYECHRFAGTLSRHFFYTLKMGAAGFSGTLLSTKLGFQIQEDWLHES